MNFGTMLMCWVVTSFLIVAASESFWSWMIVPVLVCYASVYFIKTVEQLPWQRLSHALWYVLEWLGSVSAALFVIHPTIRKIFIPISRQGDMYAGLLLYVIAALGAAWLVKEVMRKIPNPKL